MRKGSFKFMKFESTEDNAFTDCKLSKSLTNGAAVDTFKKNLETLNTKIFQIFSFLFSSVLESAYIQGHALSENEFTTLSVLHL